VRYSLRTLGASRMLRALLRLMFGGQHVESSSAGDGPSPWREAPSKTWRDEVGAGVVATVTIQTGHSGYMSVVGESHYQPALRALAARRAPGNVFTARLVPEPDNPYDSNAVAVVMDGDGS
jgi:hypothetical protein